MRFRQSCIQCATEAGAVVFSEERLFRDKNLYEFECPRGHKNYMALVQHKYEVLADLAINAYLDEYFLQSFSTFATSLERTYEWFVKVIFFHKHQNLDLFTTIWKNVHKQSERQLGLYMGTFLGELKSKPPMLTDDESGSRNSVVHRGRFPTQEETCAFARRVVNITQELKDIVTRSYRAAELNIDLINVGEFKKMVPEGGQFSTSNLSLCYNISDGAQCLKGFDAILQNYISVRRSQGLHVPQYLVP